MGLPMPGMVSPTLDVSDLDKRIAELKSVENWLNLNLNVLRMSIQGFEMQKAAISAMKAGGGSPGSSAPASGSAKDATSSATGGGVFPDAWWSVLQTPPRDSGETGGGSSA